MTAFFKGILLGMIVAAGLCYGARHILKPKPAASADEARVVSQEDFLSVKGENTLLKKMLGQVEGEIVILGPVGKQSGVQGKLVWDKTMQQGFLHAEGMDATLTYQLVLKSRQGAEVVVAEESGQTLWQIQFKTPQRVLDLMMVELQGKGSPKETDGIAYARGVVSEN
jgi:hypothetical protein